jgi:hypothetical protein
MRIIQSIVLTLVAAISVPAATPIGGDWEGVIKLQNQDLRVVLHVKEAAGKLRATVRQSRSVRGGHAGRHY